MTMAEPETGTTTGPQHPRPLSPHLQVYKLTLTFLMSGFHRITGTVLYFGIVLIAWWLVAAASGPNAYANVEWFMGSLIGRLVLFGYTWALLHHMLGGVRHLIWDTATLVGSISLTLIVWVVGYLAMGGPR
jgi:succinate dehydrogenase / fumarate reductase cytochrome b subunit